MASDTHCGPVGVMVAILPGSLANSQHVALTLASLSLWPFMPESGTYC